MSATISPSGVKTTTNGYDTFAGLDTSRDLRAKDGGDQFHLEVLNNGTCDWRGQIVRDPACDHRFGSELTTHVRFFGQNEIVCVTRTANETNLLSERGHSLRGVYSKNSIVTSATFNRTAHFFTRGAPSIRYDGQLFSVNPSVHLAELAPAYAVAVQGRLAVAGVSGQETTVFLSRANNETVFPDDEETNSENVLRAGFIDIANLLGTADEITGLAAFEQNRMVIFTSDRAIIYRIDPDLEQWQQDDSANIQVGCASHNTIVNAGTDVIFCSRTGIHSIKRSSENGILVYSYSLSDKVDLLYRDLYDSVPNPEEISAVFDQDRGHYHVYFPQAGGQICKRLTIAMNPEQGGGNVTASTGDFLNARCAAFLAGRFVIGTTGGVYDVLQENQQTETSLTPTMEIVTPMLWHGSLTAQKQVREILIQASGRALLNVTMHTDTGARSGSLTIETTGDVDDTSFSGVPLSNQYQRKWPHIYKGAQYRIVASEGDGLFRLVGLAIVIQK